EGEHPGDRPVDGTKAVAGRDRVRARHRLTIVVPTDDSNRPVRRVIDNVVLPPARDRVGESDPVGDRHQEARLSPGSRIVYAAPVDGSNTIACQGRTLWLSRSML